MDKGLLLKLQVFGSRNGEVVSRFVFESYYGPEVTVWAGQTTQQDTPQPYVIH